jgi:transcription elongation factor GreA
LSAHARQRLEQELAVLRERRRLLEEALLDIVGVEDRGDQAQRLQQSDDLARVSDRIREIIDVLSGRVRPSSVDALPEDTVVTVRFSDGSTDTMRVVTIPDDSSDTLTRDSPLGRALVGAEPGNTITYSGPNGLLTADVVAIRPPNGHSR